MSDSPKLPSEALEASKRLAKLMAEQPITEQDGPPPGSEPLSFVEAATDKLLDSVTEAVAWNSGAAQVCGHVFFALGANGMVHRAVDIPNGLTRYAHGLLIVELEMLAARLKRMILNHEDLRALHEGMREGEDELPIELLEEEDDN